MWFKRSGVAVDAISLTMRVVTRGHSLRPLKTVALSIARRNTYGRESKEVYI